MSLGLYERAEVEHRQAHWESNPQPFTECQSLHYCTALIPSVVFEEQKVNTKLIFQTEKIATNCACWSEVRSTLLLRVSGFTGISILLEYFLFWQLITFTTPIFFLLSYIGKTLAAFVFNRYKL